MLRKIEDFQKDWAYEAEMTAKVLRALTDESPPPWQTSKPRDMPEPRPSLEAS